MVIILFGRRIKYLIPFYKRKKTQKSRVQHNFQRNRKKETQKEKRKKF